MARCDDRVRDHYCDRGAARHDADRPPLARPRSGPLLAGVAAGRRAHLRQDPLVVRVAFVVLATTGLGVIAYALLWMTMAVGAPGEDDDARDLRPGARRVCGSGRPLIVAVIAMVPCSGRWPLGHRGAGPPAAARVGRARRHLAAAGHRPHPRLPAVRWALAGGVALAAGGLVLLLATTGQLAAARNGFAATLVILTGVALATAPLWRRLLESRGEERTARIRSEERAAVAAHLHDSVLQTLALIQRHAEEPQAVSRLARSQERELRAWLYDPKVVREGGTWAGLVAGMVADVESDHAFMVDPVVVGDAPIDDALAGLGAATREALVNAAKHSGATAADLYTEVTPERVSVFVRDRGKGFDPTDGVRRPARPAGLGARPAHAPGWDGGDPVGAGRGDRGGARPSPGGHMSGSEPRQA